MTGLLLMLLSIVLFLPLSFFSLIYGVVDTLVKFHKARPMQRMGKWFKNIAIAIDELGNVWCAAIFNAAFVKEGGTKHGDFFMTISLVIALNKRDEKLTWAGRLMWSILELAEDGHCEKAIKAFSERIDGYDELMKRYD